MPSFAECGGLSPRLLHARETLKLSRAASSAPGSCYFSLPLHFPFLLHPFTLTGKLSSDNGMEGSKCPHSWIGTCGLSLCEMGVGIQDNGCESDTVLGLRDPGIYRTGRVLGCMAFSCEHHVVGIYSCTIS